MGLSSLLAWRRRTRILAALLLLSLWWLWVRAYIGDFGEARWRVTALLIGAAPLVLGSAVTLAVIAHRSRSLSAAIMLASPAIVLPAQEFAVAAQRYADDEGYLIRTGMQLSFPLLGIDPQTRIPVHFSGCLTSDVWEARVWINNTTTRWLSENLGPMEGLYFGPLPSRKEGERQIAQHGRLLEQAYDGRAVRFDGMTYPIRPQLRDYLDAIVRDDEVRQRFRVAVLHDEMLLVKRDADDPDGHGRLETFRMTARPR
ncbi:MAG: hypothetical protein K0V04_01070 [Deltaproteobacteria bacterium]|nr:hypothetical protein [Deltaproteobacteria bacterium]